MPSTTIPRAITAQEAASALQEQLGSRYHVTSHGNDSLTVKHSSLAFATVRLGRDGDATTFHVHGGGLIVGRIINEFGVARTATAAIKDAYASAHGS